ncbi:mannosyl-oligosaccharide alpha-1,2-mannosidase [Exophiala aquamarina CBS 119918]|uniref:alpha-1,2-Mannosidase n=1 Tax=Exophiala aquamarina CBS 119918 TaxID=1182545 RepID=A0A072PRB2_9EURO|nr:mannosyl-oligosaccharide alpha-1,2-mannosidase [Exophiala aquamarina CBS 119918]KEF62649.1 mannosyl-oligosaccharide alpha-1,2-mannosidase [Exophiala aquamarina CBS 119918]
MIRIRRYRAFLIVASLAIFTIYHLSRVNHWDGLTLGAAIGFHPEGGKTTPPNVEIPPDPVPLPEEPVPPLEPVIRPAPSPALPTEPKKSGDQLAPEHPIQSSSRPVAHPDARPTVTGEEFLTKQPALVDDFGERGQGRLEVQPRPKGQQNAYWKQQRENFPVPSPSLINLPSGQPKALPRIQFSFGKESSTQKTERLRRQTTVRESFKHAWHGYKNLSLPHDELKPISKGAGDPFNGWGATLVDSLDTLWIMGLHDEFEEAVGLVKNIDFKTTTRKDIPLFETTIRYLGGLIAAYDVSKAKHKVLLDKAVELADVLMGAFDTPNRMPIGYYNWAPSYASQPHRASTHMVLAELGSLSVEFTRLAQITREVKYYDAVARITDALEKWQLKTTLPGLWPLKLDASGCKKSEVVREARPEKESSLHPTENNEEVESPGSDDSGSKSDLESSPLPKRQVRGPPRPVPDLTREGEEGKKDDKQEEKNQEESHDGADTKKVVVPEWAEEFDNIDCEPQGLNTEPHATSHNYGIGAMADSTYEYFPKQYALLGGLNNQYRRMYLDAIEVVRTELLYRPMTKDNQDILFAAKQIISPKEKEASKRRVNKFEGTHLGCFAGGMFALGSKIFDIPNDMAIAEKLTNGCVWAYGSTPVGVMAEEFELVPCDSLTSCEWDEAKWHKALDPQLKERFQAVELYNMQQQILHEAAIANADRAWGDEDDDTNLVISDPSSKRKRDLESRIDDDSIPIESTNSTELEHELVAVVQPFVPKVPLSHEKYVAARISEERLPPGYTKIKARDYRLRPEAIESVFIMYRMTGDESWREKGWKMFSAVDRATKTDVAHAAVKDVTSQLMEQDDTMESFWLAETLKYYYLLFSDPGLISLDEYVLNTEAHPFKRPQ